MSFFTRKFWCLSVLLFCLISIPLTALESLFWDYPDIIKPADGGRFPQIVSTGGGAAVVWQEFEGRTGSLNSSISIRALISADGNSWDGPVITIAEDLPYLWQEKVPLFSAAADQQGKLVVAVAEALKGVGIYSADSSGTYRRTALLKSGSTAADTTVAPRLSKAADGQLLLFLTRRAVLAEAENRSILTIFLSTSRNGRNWSKPELFISPDQDTGSTEKYGNLPLLEQNFLPYHLAYKGRDYVAFQSLRQGRYGRTYQIYLKIRDEGGRWQPAVPVTELLTPVRADTQAGSDNNEKDPLSWNNQRPSLGLSAQGDILLTWERRHFQLVSNISLIPLDSSGRPKETLVENVVEDRSRSVFPHVFSVEDQTWILWFDDSGIRLGRRAAPYNYRVQARSLSAATPGADRNSAIFPYVWISPEKRPCIMWEDSAGGRSRTVYLRPDIFVDVPRLRKANFSLGRTGNIRTLVVDWQPPEDSSDIISYSWLWSRNSESVPSREPEAQKYRMGRVVYTIENPSEEEGAWYFSLIVQDQAGNWSEPLRLSYILDLTPMPPPLVRLPAVDPFGYLTSNSFSLEWDDAGKEEASYYIWRMDYLGNSPEKLNLEQVGTLPLTDTTETSLRSHSWVNLDNGVWAFTIAAVDQAGNRGLPNTELLFTRRYIPVTFITNVSARQDDIGRVFLRITGRGFAAGGRLSKGIIDRNGKPPWDYEYVAADGRLKVLSDRAAEITGIEDMEKGVYRIGVVHPRRGTVFWNRKMKLDATGTIKFGPFGLYAYESLWKPAAESLGLSGNTLLTAMLGLLGGMAVLIALVRLSMILRESRNLEKHARAILARESMSAAARREAALMLRRKGMRLRTKFLMWLTLLIFITILLVAVFLGLRWVRMELSSLAENMESESRLLVETIASSAINSISAADRGTLLLLPDRVDALPDALWTTVTGPRGEIVNGTLRATSDGFDYIWASNDPDILNKIRMPLKLSSEVYSRVMREAGEKEKEIFESLYTVNTDGSAVYIPVNRTLPDAQEKLALTAALLRRVNILPAEAGIGKWETEDAITSAVRVMREEVEQDVQDAGISRMIAELTVLEAQRSEAAARAIRTLNFDDPEFVEAREAVAAQKKEIQTLLLEESNTRFSSYPEFNAEQLRPGGPDYFIFYKPLLYQEGNQDSGFFKGTVRVAVSVAGIRSTMYLIQRRIIITTSWVSVVALAIGVGAALLISSLISRPIMKLGAKVQEIQDEKDKEELRDFDTGIRSSDEIGLLSDNINNMVKGLVQAAREQKELLAGQEIQKTFLPMLDVEKNKKGDDVRLSTGGDSNAFFRLFGYYEGADAVSGDFFGYRKLDEDHRVLMKLDISGHGVTASMIMVQAASLFVDYFRQVENRVKAGGRLEFDLQHFTFGLNDLMIEVNFRGRFAAFNLSVINVRTGDYQMIHAGDNLVNIYDPEFGKVRQVELPEAPAAGTFDSSMIEMQNEMRGLEMYKPVNGRLKKGEILFLYTDGIEEAHHLLRNENFEEVRYSYFSDDMKQKDQEFVDAGYKTIMDVAKEQERGENAASGQTETLPDNADDSKDPRWEEFDTVRIKDVIEAVMHRREYVLKRRLDLTIGKPLHFDFTSLESGAQNAVMALAAVEKVFRLVPDPKAGSHARTRVDRKIDDFLKKYFREYHEFFNYPVQEESDIDYIYFSHLLDDPQDDDLTLWAFEKL